MKPNTERPSYLLMISALALVSSLPAARLQAAPPMSAEGKRVVEKVRAIISDKVSSPGGRVQLRIVPGAHPERGEFREIAAAGSPAKVRKLEITSINLRAQNVRIKVADLFKENKIRTVTAKTSLRAVVTDNDLTHYLARGRHTRDMKLLVRFQGKATRVTGKFAWGWFSGPVDGLGRLRLGPNYKVYFDIVTLKLNGKDVPQWVKTKFSDKINPIINYDDVPFRPQFRELKIVGNSAVLTA